MSPELPLTAYVETFAEEWQQAEELEAKEFARRSLITGVLLIAEQAKQGTIVVSEESIAAAGLRSYRQHPALWQARSRLVFGSMQSPARASLPSPAELLESLAVRDGRFRHDLSVFVP